MALGAADGPDLAAGAKSAEVHEMSVAVEANEELIGEEVAVVAAVDGPLDREMDVAQTAQNKETETDLPMGGAEEPCLGEVAGGDVDDVVN